LIFHFDYPLALLSDHQTLYRFLEACKLSLNSRTAAETHARIITFGYGNYPSLVACLISTYARCDRTHPARKILDQVFCWDFDLVSVNIIIESLMKNGECDFAKKVFYKMPTRDVVTWNSIIGGFVKNVRFQEALRFFRDMLGSNVQPDASTFASIMSGCARFGSLKNAQWVHALVIENKIELNSILSAALVDMYAKCGRIQTAKEVFDSVRRDDVSVWNAIINGLASHGLGSDALALFSKMELENVLPDSITFIGILTACSHCGLVEQGWKYFDLMRNCYSIEPQLQHYGAMVDLLGRAGRLEEAYAIIDSMPMEPDIVIWRALLSACKTYKKPALGEIAIANISRLRSGDYVLLSNIYLLQRELEK
jgi:pentatricopeptide repeat protein